MSPTPLKAPTLLPSGPFETIGNQIVDPVGVAVRLCGVNWNWYGGPNTAPDLLNTNISYHQSLQALVAGGINVVKICTSDASVVQNKPLVANTISNPDLVDTTYNSAMQTVVDYGYSIGLQFIIESHNSEGTNIVNQGARNPNGLWYDVGGLSNGTDGGNNVGTITDTIFLSSWQTRAQLFANNLAVIGYDIRNEPLCFGDTGSGCSWGPYGPSATAATIGTSVDIASMYQRVGNAILTIDPTKLIICEGPLNPNGSFTNVGNAPWGDLSAVGNYPITLNVSNRVVYSHHIFPTEIDTGVPDSGNTYQQYYNTGGYLMGTNMAPYFIGSCGDTMATIDAFNWSNMFIPWINGNITGVGSLYFDTTIDQGPSWTWWDLKGMLSANKIVVDPLQFSFWSQIFPWPVKSQPLIVNNLPITPLPNSANTAISGPTQVIQFLNSIAGKNTISGQYVETCGADGVVSGFTAVQTIHALTGFWLGLIEGDYYHATSTGAAETNFNSVAIDYWNHGGLISLSLSIPNPTSGGNVSDGQFCNFSDIVKPGMPTNVAWMNSLAQIATGLLQLQAANVTVLLRIYHDCESTNFWWGPQNATAAQFVAMWQQTYNYFVTTKGLYNLVWVFGGVNDYARFPGNPYVDIIGLNAYSNIPGPNYQNIYNTLISGDNNLPYAMNEFGPTAGFDQTILINTFNQMQPLTTYWVQWWNNYGMQNSINLTTALAMPRVLNRGQFSLPTTSPL